MRGNSTNTYRPRLRAPHTVRATVLQNIHRISNIKKRGDGGTLNQGQISVVGEKGPELMMAKQDVNIVPNKDVKYVPPSTSTKPVQTVVRTIIQKQGKI